MTPWLIKELMVIVPALGTPITGIIIKGWQLAIHWEQSLKLTSNQKANASITQATEWATTQAKDAAINAVNAINQQLANGFKAANADHKLTGEQAVQCFQAAVAKAESGLSAQAKATLTDQIGNIPTYLGTLIEAFVPQAPTKYVAPATASTPSA